MDLSSLIHDDKNANKGTRRGRNLVERSLRDFGAGRSILIDRDGRVIAGNKTLESAKAAGLTNVEVIQSDGTKIIAVQRTDISLDDPKGRQLAIADNRTAEIGLEWDPEVLGQLASDLDLQPFFTEAELRGIVPSNGSDLLTDEDSVPETPEEPISKLGDLFILGDHRLLCADATDPNNLERLLDSARVDMVFTDPPYGISVQMNNPGTTCKGTILGDATTDVAAAAYNLCAALDVPIIFWGANHYAADARLPNAKCWLCWDKQESNNHIDQADCEFAWTNIDSPARIFHHLWAGFRRDSEKGERRVHPTQKPIALIVELLNFFEAGKVILDLFGGSGSTLIACEQSRRSAYLMELDPHYCDVIIKRWEDATGQKAELYGRKTTETLSH